MLLGLIPISSSQTPTKNQAAKHKNLLHTHPQYVLRMSRPILPARKRPLTSIDQHGVKGETSPKVEAEHSMAKTTSELATISNWETTRPKQSRAMANHVGRRLEGEIDLIVGVGQLGPPSDVGLVKRLPQTCCEQRQTVETERG